ncbi:ribonuclease HI family protein [Tepidibacter mesophilus]|uniref:ribonuclease HI family protein n=1 Tax=Tepidibacter mesophilus TaxID=655607 RepID=UPI00165145A1|nr:ribonuclease HI family protein [Tepidibacter mesophilus]
MIKCNFDGACNDNGNKEADTGLGYAIYDTKYSLYLKEVSLYGGKGTNNTAEYKALIECMKDLIELGLIKEEINVYGDSDLIIKQVTGQWKCKKEHLRLLRDEAISLMDKFHDLNIKWVPRNENAMADKLSKEGLNKKNVTINTSDNKRISKDNLNIAAFNLGDGIYKVVDDGCFYAVDINRTFCSCLENQNNRKKCNHIMYIENM